MGHPGRQGIGLRASQHSPPHMFLSNLFEGPCLAGLKASMFHPSKL